MFFYQERPLLCRLFGFSARKNKNKAIEVSLCKVLKGTHRELLKGFEVAGFPFGSLPISQETFMRIAPLRLDMGWRYLSIDMALHKALEFLHWRRHTHTIFDKAG